MVEVSHLEWHITHSCNFMCQGCGHFTNDGYNEHISINDLKEWYSLWKDKIKPKELSILGGEPLLHKDLIDIIYMTKEEWNIQEDQYYEIVTNGVLIDRHPELPKALYDTNCVLTISMHSYDKEYLKVFLKSLSKINEWIELYGINVVLNDSANHWIKTYHGNGKNILPFEDNDPQMSWDRCPSGQQNFQLYNGEIYKCSPLAYLQLKKRKYGDQLSSKWDPYLKYKPLSSDSTEEEVYEFFNRGSESVCGMCPKNPQKFIKSNPLKRPID